MPTPPPNNPNPITVIFLFLNSLYMELILPVLSRLSMKFKNLYFKDNHRFHILRRFVKTLNPKYQIRSKLKITKIPTSNLQLLDYSYNFYIECHYVFYLVNMYKRITVPVILTHNQ